MRGKKRIECTSEWSAKNWRLIYDYNDKYGQETEHPFVLHNIRMRQDMKWMVEARSKELGMNASNFIRLAVFKLLQEL